MDVRQRYGGKRRRRGRRPYGQVHADGAVRPVPADPAVVVHRQRGAGLPGERRWWKTRPEAWLLDHEAGSGPFTIKRWQVGYSYEFDAVEDYQRGAGRRKVRPAGYIWKVSRESSSTRLMLLSGDAHIGFDLSSEDAEALKSQVNAARQRRARLRLSSQSS